MCRIDGGCGATQCDDGEVLACDAGPHLGWQACTGGSFGACTAVRCTGNGVCALALQLSSEPGGCGPASFAAADAGWASVEVCGDGKDNDCNGQTDERPTTPCRLQAGVCAGATPRCGESEACSPATYTAHARDAGQLYEAFELACDGQDNDCDGLVDISREKSMGPGTEVVLIAERFGAPDASYVAVIADERPQRIRTSQWTGALDPAAGGVDVRVLSQAVPRTMLAASEGNAGTFAAWRVMGGFEAALVTNNGNVLFKGTVTGNVTAGPRLLTPPRPGPGDTDAFIAWVQPNETYLSAVRAAVATALPQPTVCDCDASYCCFPFALPYVDASQDELSVFGFGLPILVDGGIVHSATLVEVPAENAACAALPVRAGPACINSLSSAGASGVLAQRFGSQSWVAGRGTDDVRIVVGNQTDPGQRHSFGDYGSYPVSDVAAPAAEEAVLALGRRETASNRGGAWLIQRTANRVIAIPEINHGPIFELSDAGLAAPSATWSARQPGHVAVAYAVARPDGGEVMGRLLCTPR